MTQTVRSAFAFFALVLMAGACGAGGESDTEAASSAPDAQVTATSVLTETGTDEVGGTADASTSDEVVEASGDDDAFSGSTGDAGTMTMGDQTITFDSSLCYLREQDAAAGGGKILFVIQAYGTDEAGEQVTIDISRYDQDSMFAGDSISLVVGDPFAGDDRSWDASGETGLVTLDGTKASAGQLQFVSMEDMSALPGSFDINC